MAFSYYGGWPVYVPVAERRKKAAREIARLKKAGHNVAPVVVEGRKIAASFWGKAWCDNLESYQDYANRVERGRSYVRNNAVIDLRIGPREVRAKVIGSEIYSILITIEPLAAAAWASICADCAGRVECSLVELLQGKLARPVMERVCRPADGLFPKPADIKFSCSCPDDASMCKHVAAALYGAGVRLDAEPELLFRLRAVDAGRIFANLDAAFPASRSGGAGMRLDASDLSTIFGIDMVPSAPSPKPKTMASPSAAAEFSSPARISPSKRGGAKTAKPGRTVRKKNDAAAPGLAQPAFGSERPPRKRSDVQTRYVPSCKGTSVRGQLRQTVYREGNVLEDRFLKRLRKKVRKGLRGWPIATIAFYGPDLSRATKVAVGIVPSEDSEVKELRDWKVDHGDVPTDPAIAKEILNFIERHGTVSVAMTDRIIGCPHQEGIDYDGDWCPVCEFWRGRDRFTGQMVQ